jgi:hypothetical protein
VTTTSQRALVLVIAIVLAGCSWLGIERPGTLSGGDVYVGEDAATITVTTEQVGCCYMEGSLRFARLEGPSSFDWAVDDGSGSGAAADDRYSIGVQTSSVEPGEYTLTAWEQVCDGNCDNLDPPQGQCTLEFTAMPGDAIEILVTYTIPDPCTAERLQYSGS